MPPLLARLGGFTDEAQSECKILMTIRTDAIAALGTDEQLITAGVREHYLKTIQFMRGRMPGSCGIVLAQYGSGRVVLSTSHPESTDPDHTGFLFPRMIAEAAHCVSNAQPSEAARLADFVQNQNGWQGQPLEESKHLYGKRLVSQPRCFSEQFDSGRYSFNREQAEQIALEACPEVDANVLAELIQTHRNKLNNSKVEVNHLLIDLLLPIRRCHEPIKQ